MAERLWPLPQPQLLASLPTLPLLYYTVSLVLKTQKHVLILNLCTGFTSARNAPPSDDF